MAETDGRILRLFYSQRDFGLALSAVDFFSEVDEEAKYSRVELRRFRCYLDEAVISYCRPFTKANGMPLLTFADLKITPTPQQIDLHKRLLSYRHKVVAHSDTERVRIVVRSIRPFKDTNFQIPAQSTPEGLDFLPDRLGWMGWLHILHSALAEALVAIANESGLEFGLYKDHLFPEDGT